MASAPHGGVSAAMVITCSNIPSPPVRFVATVFTGVRRFPAPRLAIVRQLGVMGLADLCLAREVNPATLPLQKWRRIMPSYSPELIRTMRAALDEVMARVPMDQATPEIKAHMAELILKTAADGQTTFESLLAVASDRIQTILSVVT
jgi:hypothetical protein